MGLAKVEVGIDGGLQIVDAAPVVVVGAAEQDAQLLLLAEAVADRAAELVVVAAAHDRIVAAEAEKIERGKLAGGLGLHIDRAADAVAIHIRRQRLVDFDGFHQVGGNHVQPDLAHGRLGRRNA